MGLFDQILGAIENPQQQASPDQLGGLLSMVQQVSGDHGVDANTTQSVISALGTQVRGALQDHRNAGNIESLLEQFGGANANPGALQALFAGGQEAQVAQTVSQQTGLSAATIQSMLPTLVPIVLQFLNSGSAAPGSTGSTPTGSNSVLNAFLDADHDGDVDLGDAMGLASRFMSR